MHLIRFDGLELASHRDSLQDTYAKLKDLHSRAYNWSAPDIDWVLGRESRRMRSYVRSWINEWDLRRLYPNAKIEIQEQELQIRYSEDKDLEKEADEALTADIDGGQQALRTD